VQKHDRLKRVKPGCVAHEFVLVFSNLTVLSKGADMLIQRGVICYERTRVTECAQILRGVETERAGKPGLPGSSAVAPGPVRLAGIFED
jgi:hypothetical protein